MQVKKNQKKQRPAKKLKQVQKRSLGCTDKVNNDGDQWEGDGVTITGTDETAPDAQCASSSCSNDWSIYVQPMAGSYTVSLETSPTGFANGDTIVISGDLLGGAPVTNDLTITFTDTNSITGEGTGVSPIHCHEAINCAITDSDDMTASSARLWTGGLKGNFLKFKFSFFFGH